MQMESYYGAFHADEAAFFFPHHVPASPELPFGLIASPELEPEQAPEARPSAFQEYGGAVPGALAAAEGGGGGGTNIHRRVMDVLGRMGAGGGRERGEDEDEEEEPQRRRRGQSADVESSRGFRHMMRERQRREKLSQSYADLYAMLQNGDKNSIVQSAAIYIHELKGARDRLQRRNEELKAKIMGHDEQQQCVKVQFEVDEPSSSIDSMIGALRRLKDMSVKTRGIRFSLSGNRLWTEMNVETTIAACEVEEALKEVERKQPDSDAPFPGSKGWTQTSHVQMCFDQF